VYLTFLPTVRRGKSRLFKGIILLATCSKF